MILSNVKYISECHRYSLLFYLICEIMQKVNVFSVIKEASGRRRWLRWRRQQRQLQKKRKMATFLVSPQASSLKFHRTNIKYRFEVYLFLCAFYITILFSSALECVSSDWVNVYTLALLQKRFHFERTRHEKCVNIKCLITRIIILTTLPLCVCGRSGFIFNLYVSTDDATISSRVIQSRMHYKK